MTWFGVSMGQLVKIEEKCRGIREEVEKGLAQIQMEEEEQEDSSEDAEDRQALGEYEPIGEEEGSGQSNGSKDGQIEEEEGLDLEENDNEGVEEAEEENGEDEEIDENQLEEFLDQLDEMDQVNSNLSFPLFQNGEMAKMVLVLSRQKKRKTKGKRLTSFKMRMTVKSRTPFSKSKESRG